MLKLYSYWRSSAAYRVRIALNRKGLDYEYAAVHLVKDGGEQHKPGYRAVNPQGLVPTLEHDGIVISQSLAILEYLDERFPSPPLLPGAAPARALARQIAYLVACDIHPINNLRVQQYLAAEFDADGAQQATWMRHWMCKGFDALEVLLKKDRSGPYCIGGQVTLADVCIVPQLYNAHRYDLPLDAYPTLRSIETACLALGEFGRASPENQPDAVR